MTVDSIKAGMKVHYAPLGKPKENGIVKSIVDGRAFVVFHCAGEWSRYKEYTGALTPNDKLHYGWVDEKGNLLEEFCDHEYYHTNAKWQSVNQMRCHHCGKTIN
jgi:hypothetical protein